MLNGYLLQKKYNEYMSLPTGLDVGVKKSPKAVKYNDELVNNYRRRIERFLTDVSLFLLI